MSRRVTWFAALALTVVRFAFSACAAETPSFRVGTYNLEGYLERSVGTWRAKTAESKSKIREHILALKADVLALQEVGSVGALDELRGSLKAEGLDYPYWELVRGYDTNIHVAVLSRFEILARRPHTAESYLLYGRRFRVTRGFAEVDIRVNAGYSFTLLAAHLKSRRASSAADEGEMRAQEARLLREIVEARLSANPNTNLVVAGDFNDVKDSAATRVLVGQGKGRLTDTRPAEQNGDPDDGRSVRRVAWTHFYAQEDVYSRVDYILLSPGMTKEWSRSGSSVLALPGWGVASDHRPVVAAFNAMDK